MSRLYQSEIEISRLNGLLKSQDKELEQMKTSIQEKERKLEGVLGSSIQEAEEIIKGKVEAEFNLRMHEKESRPLK